MGEQGYVTSPGRGSAPLPFLPCGVSLSARCGASCFFDPFFFSISSSRYQKVNSPFQALFNIRNSLFLNLKVDALAAATNTPASPSTIRKSRHYGRTSACILCPRRRGPPAALHLDLTVGRLGETSWAQGLSQRRAMKRTPAFFLDL